MFFRVYSTTPRGLTQYKCSTWEQVKQLYHADSKLEIKEIDSDTKEVLASYDYEHSPYRK